MLPRMLPARKKVLPGLGPPLLELWFRLIFWYKKVALYTIYAYIMQYEKIHNMTVLVYSY